MSAEEPPILVALRRLEERWAQEGAPVARGLRPGLCPEDLDRAEEALGFPLPQEVRDWFGWHDGVQTSAQEHRTLPVGLTPFSLQDSIQSRDDLLGRAQPEIGRPYHPEWLPLAERDAVQLVLDCTARSRTAAAAILIVDFWTDSDWDEVRCPSLTELVQIWWELTEQGLYRYDPARPGWDKRYLEIPEHLRRAGLV